MTIPTEVSFRDMEPSEPLRTLIVEHAQRLERFATDILSCHVTVGHEGSHRHQGHAYKIHARISMRGRQIDVSGSSKSKPHKEDAYSMVGETFDALRRRVEDYVRERRGDVKRSSPAT